MATIIDNSTEKMLTRTLIAGVDSGLSIGTRAVNLSIKYI